jgi:hypothetical protein
LINCRQLWRQFLQGHASCAGKGVVRRPDSGRRVHLLLSSVAFPPRASRIPQRQSQADLQGSVRNKSGLRRFPIDARETADCAERHFQVWDCLGIKRPGLLRRNLRPGCEASPIAARVHWQKTAVAWRFDRFRSRSD